VEAWWAEVQTYRLTTALALFFPCAKAQQAGKIIQRSVTHTWAAALTRWAHPLLQRVIISEPLTIIPYARRDYPTYNYPPALLRENALHWERDYPLFVERLSGWLRQQSGRRTYLWFGPTRYYHHLRILQAAWPLNEPLFTVWPTGGTRNIGYGARCLRFEIERALRESPTDSPTDHRLKYETSRYFILTSKGRKKNPSVQDIDSCTVAPQPFFQALHGQIQATIE
jgi:hypothetical protein